MPFSWKWWLFCANLGKAFFLPSHAFSFQQSNGRSCRTFRRSSHEETSAPIATAQPETRGEATKRETLAYLQDYLSLTDAQTKKLESTNSLKFAMRKETLEPKILYLKERLSLDNKQLSKLVQRLPSALAYSIKENLEPKLLYLQERLALDDKQLTKLVQRLPQLLCLSVEETLEPKLLYLQERLALDDKQLSKLVQRLPAALGYSIEENLEPKVLYMKERLLLEDKQLSKLVQISPSVLGYSIDDNLEPKVLYLKERLLLEDKQLSKLVQRLPTVFNYSIEENLELKIDFFASLLGKEATRDLILKYSSLLSLSLENRLKPRLVDVQEAGIPIDSGTIQRMGFYTEEKWSKSLAYQKKKLLKSGSGELW